MLTGASSTVRWSFWGWMIQIELGFGGDNESVLVHLHVRQFHYKTIFV